MANKQVNIGTSSNFLSTDSLTVAFAKINSNFLDLAANIVDTPSNYGAIGNGIVDDSAAINTALIARTGSSVSLPTRHNVINLNVPPHTVLAGRGGNGIVRYTSSWYDLPSSVKISGGGTIRGSNASVVDGLVLVGGGLTQPTNDIPTCRANLAKFATNPQALTYGDGSTVGFLASDAMVSNTTIVGFDQAVWIDGTDPALFAGRFDMRDVKIDCNSGVYINNVADVARLHNVHCWPFTAYVPGHSPVDPNTYDIIQRPGTAFYIKGACDWAQLSGCFSYGYAYSVVIDTASNVQVNDHQADNVGVSEGQAGVGTVYKKVAYRIVGNSENARLTDCTSISYPTAIQLAVSGSVSNRPSLIVRGGLYIASSVCVDLISGNAVIEGAILQGAQYGIYVHTGMGNVKISLAQAGGVDGTHIATLLKVESGYTGYLDLEVPVGAQGSWDTLYDIPDATLRTGRIRINGCVPWLPYTPGAASASGTIGAYTSTGWFQIHGNTCDFQVQVVISQAGNASGYLNIGLPVGTKRTFICVGRSDVVGGYMIQGAGNAGTNNLVVARHDNSTAIYAGAQLTLSGSYEILG